MTKMITNPVALLDIIPIDLLFSFTSLKYDKHYFNTLKICSKSIYNKFKEDSLEICESFLA